MTHDPSTHSLLWPGPLIKCVHSTILHWRIQGQSLGHMVSANL